MKIRSAVTLAVLGLYSIQYDNKLFNAPQSFNCWSLKFDVELIKSSVLLVFMIWVLTSICQLISILQNFFELLLCLFRVLSFQRFQNSSSLCTPFVIRWRWSSYIWQIKWWGKWHLFLKLVCMNETTQANQARACFLFLCVLVMKL